MCDAFDRLLEPGATVEGVAHSFLPPLVCDPAFASELAGARRERMLRRLIERLFG
jgi:hypothetical protein